MVSSATWAGGGVLCGGRLLGSESLSDVKSMSCVLRGFGVGVASDSL